MHSILTRSRLVAFGAVCAAGGVGAGAIADAGASTNHSGSRTTAAAHAHAHRFGAKGDHGRLLRRAVQGSFVVHTKSGFQTVSIERGTVDAVSGDTLTITEGTPKASYKQVSLTIPASAKVRNNKQTASLSSLTAGERVLVATLPKHTIVRAHTAKSAS